MKRHHAFPTVTDYGTALNRAIEERTAAEFIDNTNRRRIETIRAETSIAMILATPIEHDGSDCCPVIHGQSIYIRHRLNDVILICHAPERLAWRDVISWTFIWKVSP